jgi:hypothetical protein
MSDASDRAPGGRFAPGKSGNPRGAARRKPKPLLDVEACYRVILEVASSEAGTAANGKPITVYEACVRSLASGRAPNRLAAKDLIDLTTTSAHTLENRERRRAQAEAEKAQKLRARERGW